MQLSNLHKGAALILLSELALVLTGVMIHELVKLVPTEVLVLARNAISLMFFAPWLLRNGKQSIATQRLPLHLARSLIGIVAMYCLFYSWGHLPLAQAAVLKQTAPFFIPIVGFFWLKENISRWTVIAILVGFIGVWIILNPNNHTQLPWVAILAIFGSALGATAKVVVRKLTLTESSIVIVFYFSLFNTLFSLVPALLVWDTPSLWVLAGMVLMAGFATLAQLLLSKGYRYAPAGQLGTFTYGSVIFASLLGWLLWDELVTSEAMLGMALVVGSGVLVMLGSVKERTSSNSKHN
ncbi:MAG: drug/metabolite transporter (DMT)-like permease [Oceanospirillaceae bacterium]|jgi:drug/metabolite transporter (DMT)-like permease